MKNLITLSALLLSVSAVAQETDHIPWKADKKLQWNDFTAPADESSKFMAKTFSTFSYKFTYNRDSLVIETNASFRPKHSWVKKGSEHLLMHEQLHFDIVEFHRRKFVERLKKALFVPGTIKPVIEQIYNETLAELRATQKQYDEETNHSIIKEAQQQWTEKINTSLKALSEQVRLKVTF